jgi:hypothetical protein
MMMILPPGEAASSRSYCSISIEFVNHDILFLSAELEVPVGLYSKVLTW